MTLGVMDHPSSVERFLPSWVPFPCAPAVAILHLTGNVMVTSSHVHGTHLFRDILLLQGHTGTWKECWRKYGVLLN